VQRGILLFLLGVWCGASVFMWFVATGNFSVARQLQDNPVADYRKTVAPLDDATLRLATRHQASEVNRLFFDRWGLAQIPIAVIALALAWKARASRRVLALFGLMLLIVVGLQVYVVPETIRLGRLLDFVPRDPAPPEEGPFWRLHHAYTGLDMFKFALSLAAAAILIRKANNSETG